MADNQLKKISDHLVIIPGDAVLMTSVALPKASRAALRRAIPFALEETLVQDIETCFFAMGETDAEGNTAVAVIERARFESYLERIRQKEWEPQKIVPDYLALPYEVGAWTRWDHDDWVSVRTGISAGFCVRKENWDTFLEFYGEKKPDQLIHFIDQQAAYDMSAPINLLQADYRSKKKVSNLNRSWKRVVYSVSALILLLFASQGAQYFYFQHASTQLQKKILLTYHRIFPNTKDTMDSHRRVNQLLHRLQHAGRSQNLLRLLQKIAPVLAKNTSLHLMQLDYANAHLDFTLAANKVSDVTAFLKILSKKGLVVTQKNLQHTKQHSRSSATTSSTQKDKVIVTIEVRQS